MVDNVTPGLWWVKNRQTIEVALCRPLAAAYDRCRKQRLARCSRHLKALNTTDQLCRIKGRLSDPRSSINGRLSRAATLFAILATAWGAHSAKPAPRPFTTLTIEWTDSTLAEEWHTQNLPLQLLNHIDRVTNSRIDLHALKKRRLQLNFQGTDLIAIGFEHDGDPVIFTAFRDSWYDQDGYELSSNLLARPLAVSRVTSRFGARFHPILETKRLHYGVDYGAPTGTPVWAIGEGVVTRAASHPVAGNFVRIAHADGYVSKYLHLSEFGPEIRKGAEVEQGQLIGKVGSTGRSTGPHLHFELHRWGRPTDPLREPRPKGPRLPPSLLKQLRETLKLLP